MERRRHERFHLYMDRHACYTPPTARYWTPRHQYLLRRPRRRMRRALGAPHRGNRPPPLPWQDTVATATIRCRVAFTHYVGAEQAFRIGLQPRELLGESEAMVRDYIQRRANGGNVSFITV